MCLKGPNLIFNVGALKKGKKKERNVKQVQRKLREMDLAGEMKRKWHRKRRKEKRKQYQVI